MALYSSFFIAKMREALVREGYDLAMHRDLLKTGLLYYPQDIFSSERTYRIDGGRVEVIEEGEGAFVGPLGIRFAPGVVGTSTLADPRGTDHIPLTRPHLLFGIQSREGRGLVDKVRRPERSEHVPYAQAVIVLGDVDYRKQGENYVLRGDNRLVRPRVVLVSSDLEKVTGKAFGDWKLENDRERLVDEYCQGLDVTVGMDLDEAIRRVAYHMDDLLPRTDSPFIRLRRGEGSFAYRRREKAKRSEIRFPYEIGGEVTSFTREGVVYDRIPLKIL